MKLKAWKAAALREADPDQIIFAESRSKARAMYGNLTGWETGYVEIHAKRCPEFDEIAEESDNPRFSWETHELINGQLKRMKE